MRRSRKPLSVARRIEGSNPSPSVSSPRSRIVERDLGCESLDAASGAIRLDPLNVGADCRTTVARGRGLFAWVSRPHEHPTVTQKYGSRNYW